MAKLVLAFIVVSAFLLVSAKKSDDVTELQIGVKYKPETCDIQAHKGDKIKVHYRGKLTDGTVFDSSYERGTPFEFTLGGGQVIKGWDQGLLGMCVGEKRKLKIPSKMGYGDRGSPPKIPGKVSSCFSALFFPKNISKEKEKEKWKTEKDWSNFYHLYVCTLIMPFLYHLF
ncbi:Peptidylprolyl isomerase [Rhynchospora pubera]|uniref:peptidylprolyl isomerase n=1 Tax=Rhynchospora pubera TaxID=906938 RepID=A0AAV8C090_9POAL|nr:Peptidylprolyl isomerase [Rhynchospora pubera]